MTEKKLKEIIQSIYTKWYTAKMDDVVLNRITKAILIALEEEDKIA